MWAQNQRWMADNVSCDHRNGVAHRVWELVCVCVYLFRFFVCCGVNCYFEIFGFVRSLRIFGCYYCHYLLLFFSSLSSFILTASKRSHKISKYETKKKWKICRWMNKCVRVACRGCWECGALCRTHGDQIIWYGDFYRFVFSLFLCILTWTISINYT